MWRKHSERECGVEPLNKRKIKHKIYDKVIKHRIYDKVIKHKIYVPKHRIYDKVIK